MNKKTKIRKSVSTQEAEQEKSYILTRQEAKELEFNKAFLGFQCEIGVIQRDAKNTYFKNAGKDSSYLTLDGLLAHVLPIANRWNLIVMMTSKEQPNGSWQYGTIIKHINGCEISNWLPLDVKKDAQQIGGQQTYFGRYTLSSLCSIADGDDDGNGLVFISKEEEKELKELLTKLPLAKEAELLNFAETKELRKIQKSKFARSKSWLEKNIVRIEADKASQEAKQINDEKAKEEASNV